MSLRRKSAQNSADIASLSDDVDSLIATSASNAVRDYGAKGNGNADDTGHLQEMFNDGGAAFISAGTFATTRPLRIKMGMQLYGLGASSIIKPGFDGPAIVCAGTQPPMPLVSPLNPDGIGKGIDFNHTQDKWIVLSQNVSFGRLHGLSGFCAKGWIKPKNTSALRNIVASNGNLTTNQGVGAGTTNGAFKLYQNAGTLSAGINTTGGYKSVSASSGFSIGTTYYVEMSFDGSNLWLYINGAHVGHVAAAGTIVQAKYEDVVMGPMFLRFMQETQWIADPEAVLDNWVFEKAAGHTGTSSYSVPGHHDTTANTLALLDFTGYKDDAVFEVKRASGSSYARFYQVLDQTYAVNGLVLDNFAIQAGGGLGICTEIATDGRFRRLKISGVNGAGLWLRNNSYSSVLEDIHITGGGSSFQMPLLIIQEASGATTAKDLKTESGLVGAFISDSGVTVDGVYSPAQTLAGLWLVASGSTSEIACRGVRTTDENGATSQVASVIADGLSVASFEGCTFEFNSNDVANIMADPGSGLSPGAKMGFDGCRFTATGHSEYINVPAGTWGNQAIKVAATCRKADASTAWSGSQPSAIWEERPAGSSVVSLFGATTYDVQPQDRLVIGDATGGDITVTLPAAASMDQPITIKCTALGGSAFFISAQPGETVEDTFTHAQVLETATSDPHAVTFESDGSSQWFIVGAS